MDVAMVVKLRNGLPYTRTLLLLVGLHSLSTLMEAKENELGQEAAVE